EALGNSCSDVGLAVSLLLLEDLVFRRRQVTGVGVQRFQQPVQRAACNHWHVWLLYIFSANVVEDLAINLDVAVSAVIMIGTGGGMHSQPANHGKRKNEYGNCEDGKLQLFRH